MMYGDSEIWGTFLAGMGELAGTAILVILGCGGCVGSLGGVPSHLQMTFNVGLAVMVVIQVNNSNVDPSLSNISKFVS